MRATLSLMFLAIYLIASSAGAEGHTCFASHVGGKEINGSKDYSIVLSDNVSAKCNDGSWIYISGIGPGLRFAAGSAFSVTCLGKRACGNYYGLKADAAVAIGLSGAVMTSRRGICVVGGASLASLGASVTASQLSFLRPDCPKNGLRPE